MSESTDSEVVVVTGASAGVGRATARAFADRGAKVGLLARGEDGLEGAREEVERAGGEAVVVPTDVADPDAVEAAAEAVEDAFGQIDIWVNNAMVSVFSPAAEMTADDYRRVTEVTYLGYVYGTQAALERMRPRDEGTIVQVGSALAYRGIPLQSAYCGAKHAIQGFTESVRTELIHDDCDVQLSMVQMPAMNTPQFEWSKSRMPKKPQPVPPIYQPEVAARAIRWAVDHDRDELWVGRSTVKAILGNRVMPRRLDNYLARGGYDSQLTDEPTDPGREHNLHEPVAEDFGAHGPFDGQARDRSYQLQASMHRRALTLLAGLVAAILSVLLGLRAASTDAE
ncbi:SDR family NAD(P)-dependent oxidoreductase [Haloterrigena sp. H1]|uniref:SDR family oxidoreductase n=1 Tax=Haloterrigena sp. H1 TaxID=2552943 RepID=UPI00110EFFB8|nr:SDR family oxidoreductase [Haloterrigena sp. H1]TMT85409.1 SDR family NAD(P)-dependent oxidoreductase [Haloterrigena sp. H1]